MRSILGIVVLLGACDAGTPTCKDAVTKARSADDSMSFDLAAALVDKCELENWDVAARRCIASAKNRHDLDACTEKLLPEEHARNAEAMATMTGFKNDMCNCTTSACAQHVADSMTKWGREQAKEQHEPPKLSPEETKQFTALGEEIAKCMQKAMSPPPPPSGADQAIDGPMPPPAPPIHR